MTCSGHFGSKLVPGTSTDPAVESFIPAGKTIAAQKAGLSVGAYIDKTFNEPGATAAVVEAILEIADIHEKCETVCEIGPGSGRFAEEIVAAVRPNAYEIYETATDWMPHLRQLPNVVVRDCDGHTLKPTPDSSVDLVHSQKTFVYLVFYAVAGYLAEMARVVRPGGTVAFDIVTEPCLDEETVATWARLGTIFRPISRTWTVDFMGRRGLALQGSHFTPLPVGRSEVLVFRRG